MKNTTETHSDMSLYATISMPESDFVEHDYEKSRQRVYDMLDELCSYPDGLQVDLLEHGQVPTQIEVVNEEERDQINSLWKRPNRLSSCEVLKFSSHIPFNFDLVDFVR